MSTKRFLSCLQDRNIQAISFLSGYFNADNREFRNVGDWAYLMSSSAYQTGHKSLNLDRGNRDVNDNWNNPQHGFSALVVFGENYVSPELCFYSKMSSLRTMIVERTREILLVHSNSSSTMSESV